MKLRRGLRNEYLMALVAVGLVYLVQSYYSVRHCGTGFASQWGVTSLLLAPAILFAIGVRPRSTIGACLVMLPWIVWANDIECVRPNEGGGAAMSYVAVFLFGIPSSLILGGIIPASKEPWRDE